MKNIFHILHKVETREPAQVSTTLKLLCCEMADFIIAPNLWLLNISNLVLLITESWQYYSSGYVNILCEMLIS